MVPQEILSARPSTDDSQANSSVLEPKGAPVRLLGSRVWSDIQACSASFVAVPSEAGTRPLDVRVQVLDDQLYPRARSHTACGERPRRGCRVRPPRSVGTR